MVREGTDVSIFTYSRMRYVVMQAVAELEKKGYNPEVRFSTCSQHCQL
jgi:pyruvate dehydrogenase E1 component beta subunit